MVFKPYKPRDYGSTADVVTRLFDAVDGGIKRIAFMLGRSPSQTQAYSDPASAEELSLDQARRLADLSAPAAALLADHFAGLAGGVFLPSSTATGRFEGLIAQSAKEWGELISATIDALADGAISPEERRRVLAELDDVLRALAAARAEFLHGASAEEPAAAAAFEVAKKAHLRDVPPASRPRGRDPGKRR